MNDDLSLSDQQRRYGVIAPKVLVYGSLSDFCYYSEYEMVNREMYVFEQRVMYGINMRNCTKIEKCEF